MGLMQQGKVLRDQGDMNTPTGAHFCRISQPDAE